MMEGGDAMARALLPFLLFALSAYAQSPEPPSEKASPLMVGIFLFMFIGSCVGYVAYTIWMAKKQKDKAK